MYLIVRHDSDRDIWIVDEGFLPLLPGGADVFELQISNIMPLIGVACPFCGHRYYYANEKSAGLLREFGCGCKESLKGAR